MTSQVSRKSGFVCPRGTCGVRLHPTRDPVRWNESTVPVGAGLSWTLMFARSRRSRNTCRNRLSRYDSGSWAWGTSDVTAQQSEASAEVSLLSVMPVRPATSSSASFCSAMDRLTVDALDRGTYGSRHFAHAHWFASLHSHSARCRHASYSTFHIVSGSRRSARYPVPPGTMS